MLRQLFRQILRQLFRQILRQLFRQKICFDMRFQMCFFKQPAILAFVCCFGFNLKKKSRRKSKYLQSTVEYLTE